MLPFTGAHESAAAGQLTTPQAGVAWGLAWQAEQCLHVGVLASAALAAEFCRYSIVGVLLAAGLATKCMQLPTCCHGPSAASKGYTCSDPPAAATPLKLSECCIVRAQRCCCRQPSRGQGMRRRQPQPRRPPLLSYPHRPPRLLCSWRGTAPRDSPWMCSSRCAVNSRDATVSLSD